MDARIGAIMTQLAWFAFACRAPTPAEATPSPAGAPANDPAALGVRLAASLNDSAKGEDFVAVTAPTVEVRFEVACGEAPPVVVKTLTGDDTRRAWHASSSATWGCGETSTPECHWSPPLQYDPASTVCKDACCEFHALTHGAAFLTRVCSKGGKVHSFTVVDGC